MKKIQDLYKENSITDMAKALFKEERAKKRLDGWFLAREIAFKQEARLQELPSELRAAYELSAIVKDLPLSISDHSIFAGTQSDSFARSYALINPAFRVESFSGYCDPVAVYDDIIPNSEITKERIAKAKRAAQDTEYAKKLGEVYHSYSRYTTEVAFFVEQVTGHLIPDFRYALRNGISRMIEELENKISKERKEKKRINFAAMKIALEATVTLAGRYADLVAEKAGGADGQRKKQLELLERTLRKVPKYGAENLYEAIQAYLLLWEVLCLEQAPNPFAFSVGNADRIFEPYRALEDTPREIAAALFKHFLTFFNVGDRSWAISQNVLIGGKTKDGMDLTNETSYALLDAYYDMNLPQPILSVKLHKNTPEKLYQELGKFFFTPGCLTPSIFNDDVIFEVLQKRGIEPDDLENYAVAGCQEPLIMGKDNGNTTNSWLNLAKILELTLNSGVSTITGKKIGVPYHDDFKEILGNVREAFYENVAFYISKMAEAANGASKAISCLPVPFLSAFMGGMESGIDTRDTEEQGTKYNGSGCLIHGLSVVADSFCALDHFLKERPNDCDTLLHALQDNFEGHEELRRYLLECPKYGNNIEEVDDEAAEVVNRVSDMIAAQKNYLGNSFRPDWSSPSTHLLYGYWVGATPDGRKAREMLGYGVDPLYGEAGNGLGFRILSTMRLPFIKMSGGYASHFGIDPKYFTGKTYEEKGIDFAKRIITPLFFNPENKNLSPFYLYVNVTTPEILRKVRTNPKKYAPSGVYIMRIHGTFVNFLDLSPEIQNDIIKRLDPASTAIQTHKTA
ncbi:pyruvate formate lyase family protein [Christensenella tenuis]|uniref:Formate C-acetyltransferase n=1 Tax=Christensenella tenuis TaxID=2763033 RepID=A0ABR7EGC6_9FIRM|nr:pyruvate formate lyase family protein [Christensenella tenuis]MBC5648817.1 hypothetical protein [Christensenella tenuis]